MTDFSAYISELSAKTGIASNVVAAWVSREKGANNNVLGVTGKNGVYGGAGLFSYPSQKAGADAAANVINTSSNYAGIRAAVKTGNPELEALAIAKSPWRLGASGVASQPQGIDKYYYNGFVEAGLLPPITGGSISPVAGAGNETGSQQTSNQATTPTTPTANPFAPIKLPWGGEFNFSSPFLFFAIALVGMTFLILGGFIATKNHIDYGAIAKSGMTAAAAA